MGGLPTYYYFSGRYTYNVVSGRGNCSRYATTDMEYVGPNDVYFVDSRFEYYVNGFTGKVLQVNQLIPGMDGRIQLQQIPPYIVKVGGSYPFKFVVEFPMHSTKWLAKQPVVHLGAYIINNLDLTRLPTDTWNRNFDEFLEMLFGLFIAVAVKADTLTHKFFVQALKREMALCFLCYLVDVKTGAKLYVEVFFCMIISWLLENLL